MHRGSMHGVMQGVHPESTAGVCTPAFPTATGACAQAMGHGCAHRGVELACVLLYPEASVCRAQSVRVGVCKGQGAPRVPLPGAVSTDVCVPPRLLHVGVGGRPPAPAGRWAGAAHLAAPPWPWVLPWVPLFWLPSQPLPALPTPGTAWCSRGRVLSHDTPSLLGWGCAVPP